MGNQSEPQEQEQEQEQEQTEPTEPILFIIQDDCYKHLYKRSHQSIEIFERPQRLRFVNLGLSTTLAWISNQNQIINLNNNNIHLHSSSSLSTLINSNHFIVSKSSNRIHTNDPSFNQIHSSSKSLISSSSSSSSQLPSSKVDEESSYLDQLIKLCRHTSHQHQLGLSEVPDHLPQGDLYLSAGTEFAVLGAIGACYDAIDSILKPNPSIKNPSRKAFVNIRPPGHHCTDTEPMGFCWANNVLISIYIMGMEVNKSYGKSIKTQSSMKKKRRRNLRISYSSLHDINSYPCESGEIDKIKDASLNLCVSNSIEQFIQNLHLQTWSDESDFFVRLYPEIWRRFEDHMSMFFRLTEAKVEDSLIFVSAGFDACELETDSISRYGMKLPTSFYHRFSQDLSKFSEKYTNGRIISFLEGGYSEKTLLGSSLSYLLGMIDYQIESEKVPWDLNRIENILELVIRSPTKEIEAEGEKEFIENLRKIFVHLDGFEKSKIDMKSEIKKMGKNKEIESLGYPSNNSSSTRGMKLRSGRLASHSNQLNSSMENHQPTTIDLMEGMFEKLKIGKGDQEKMTPQKETITPKKETQTPKKDKTTPKKEIQTPKKDKTTPKKETQTPKKDKTTPKKESQTQRLKLVWKSEGIN